MEAILDVFSSDAFSFVALTDSINKLPFVPGRLGALGLFTEAPVPTTSIALEEQAGILTLVNPTPRGGPGETRPKPLRRARVLKVPHYQLDDNVLAEEVQNVREFGPQMQPRSVETYLSGRMEMFTAQLDVTTEFQRVGAIKGLIVDRDGDTIYDLYTEFGVTAVTPINFALGNANTAVRKKCSQLVRTMSQTLGGVAFTSVYGLCGDAFWDDLIEHAEVRDTYRYQEGVRLREGVVFSTLKYGGITFENYRGWIGGGTDAHEMVKGFVDRTDRVLALIEGFVPEAAWLSDPETLTYLHACISTRRHRVRVPDVPMYLDAFLVDEPLIGGLAPRLGSAHLRVLSIMGFPVATYPGILDELNRLAFPYRWSTRAICLDKTDATKILARIRRQWFAKRKSVAAILKEVMTNEASALLDSDAHNKALDADAALQELGADLAGEAYLTATLAVWDENPQTADEKLRLAEKIIQGRDFTCIAESVNAVESWLGSLPGHVYANVRQPPISTLNLAHMIPLSAVWAGSERNDHLGGPPLLFARTDGATPFRLSLHVGDVGHTLVVGPTGAGKSVLLALIALQFRRYPQSQVFAFDFGGSIRAAALAMGGDWHDLGGALSEDVTEPVALAPLSAIDDPAERAWAAEWLAAILGREGVAVTPEAKEHVWSALSSLASAPLSERTLTGFAVLLQSGALKQALRPYCFGGPYGRLLDAEAERLGQADVQAFETEGLIGTGAAPAVLAYLFHRIEGKLDGRPTLLIIDEGWLVLDEFSFGAQLREWLKTLRKKNASVVFATQSLADIERSPIAPAIIESCLTRLFLPNDRAIEPQIAAIYRRFGLNDRQIEILARAIPKRDYYCQSARGNRLFELGLGDVALAFCAASAKTDQAAITEILNEHGRAGFAAAWLRRKGLDWAADLLTAKPSAPESNDKANLETAP